MSTLGHVEDTPATGDSQAKVPEAEANSLAPRTARIEVWLKLLEEGRRQRPGGEISRESHAESGAEVQLCGQWEAFGEF